VPTINGSRIVTLGLAGLLSFGALPGLATAADAPVADSSVLEEITVTANKLNATKVLDTPVSIQAISGDALQRAGASGIMDIAGDIPGLSIQDLGPGDKKYVIRGINSTGASTTGVYYGEAVISGSNADDGGGFESDIRLYDMDRVEVLRGPQGTLYGASSMSGTIRFIPKLPNLNKIEGYGTVEASQTSHAPTTANWNINGALNLPIIEGMLSLRVVGWKLHDAGYVNQIRVGTIGRLEGVNDDNVGGGRVALRYQPFDDLTIDANYTAQTENSNGSSRWTPPGVTAFHGGPIVPVQGCDLCNTDVTQSPWSDNLRVYGLTAAYNTHFGTVTATSNQFDRRTSFNFDSTPILVSFDVPIAAETLEPRNRKVNSSELRYASDLNSPVNFVVGGYREHETQDLAVEVIKTDDRGLPIGQFSSSNAADALSNPNGNTFFGRTDSRRTTQWAGFGEATWKVNDALTAIVGARYFTETLNGVQTQTHPFGGFPGAPNLVPITDPEQSFNKVTWKENVSYKFNDALLAYETVSTGFRSGGLNAVSEPFEPIPIAYAPDTLTNFEVGTKGRLFEGQLEYQLDAYFIRWDNIQVQETTADAAFVYLGNAGRAHVKGVEFELTARPIEYLTVNFAGSYQDAFLVKGASAQQYALNSTLGRTGDDIPNVPKYQFNLGLNYTRPIAGDWQGMAAADVIYRDSMDAYFTSNLKYNLVLAPYTLVNLRTGVINGPWSVTAFARNIANKRAQVSAINSAQDPNALLTVQPRTIGLTITRKF
jgi:outer membrane receptor protein involved in Fe transport